MIKLGFIFFFGVLFQSCERVTRIYCEGPITKQERELTKFDRMVVQDGMNVTFTVGGSDVAYVTAQDNLLPYIETQIKDSVLTICRQKNTVFSGDHNIVIDVVGSGLSSVEATGGSVVECANDVVVQKFAITCSGGAEVQLRGEVENLSVECSGGSKMGSFELSCTDLLIKASGGGYAHLTMHGKADVVLSGGSQFVYQGDGVINSANISGGSTITKREF